MYVALRRAPAFVFSWGRYLASDISSTSKDVSVASPTENQAATPAASSTPDDPERARRRHIMSNLAPSFNNADKSKAPRLPTGAQAPWIPSSQLTKRKQYKRRSQHMLQTLRSEYQTEVSEEKKDFPKIKPGDILEVSLVVPENDMRPASFTGICMGIKNNGPMTRFRMRNTIKGTGPVERTFLLYSPFLKAIKVKRSIPVRRAKLTYLREKKDAASTFR